MNLERLKGAIRDFRSYFGTTEEYRERWVYALQFDFRQGWDPAPERIQTCYDSLLRSDVSTRYWKHHASDARKMMLAFLQTDPEFCAQAFSDLFCESLDLEVRIDRFQFYSDEMLRLYREKNPLSIENNHYQDHQIISFYLSLRYPEKYCYFEPERFREFMIEMKSKNIPSVSDPARFFKLAGLLMTFLQKDEEIMRLQSERLEGTRKVEGSRWIVSEFIRYSTQ